MTTALSRHGQRWHQGSFDELDQPLRDVTFVVLDLETTGGRPAHDGITEVGAVKVRGGEVLGEFQSLVDPGVGIPPFISVLTGITDTMVARAPRIGAVLPGLLEFLQGSVLVAHNARFDVGFLAAACHELGVSWPKPPVLDTVTIARRVVPRDEVANHKLETLAAHFGTPSQPVHRALADARATVDVLHALLDRLGSFGVHTLPDLQAFNRAVSPAQRRKRHLAADLPTGPGIYIFRGSDGSPLYVGTSQNVRQRVRNYFVASETRSRMGEMVALTESIEGVECAHALEAQVRELRLISAWRPRYNRRSRNARRAHWLVLTDEPYPRLSIVATLREGVRGLGPLRSSRLAETIRDAIHDSLALRRCTQRLSIRQITRPACALAEIGRCGAPCEHRVSVTDYGKLVHELVAAWHGDPQALLVPLQERIVRLAELQRYEEAADVRDRAAAVAQACARMQRMTAVSAIGELVAAGPDGTGGWQLCLIRHGRLAAAGVAPRGQSPYPVIDALRATAETVHPGPGPLGVVGGDPVLADEVDLLLRWLSTPGVRLVASSDPWCSPARGASAVAATLTSHRSASHRSASHRSNARRLQWQP